MMQMILPLLSLLLLLLSSQAQPIDETGEFSSQAQVYFGTLRFQISSEQRSDARIIISNLVARTSEFLDMQLNEYFTETISDDYFSHTGLSVLDFELEDENNVTEAATSDITSSSVVLNQYTASIEFSGNLHFHSIPLPGSKFLEERIKTIFQSDARREFVAHLQFSDSHFLNSIQHMIIILNDRVIASEDLSHFVLPNPVGEEGGANSTILIAGCAAGGALFCILAALCLCCCCCRKASSSSGDSQSKPNLRTTKTADDEDNTSSVGSPSVEPSLISQESSLFTYNPRHHYTYGKDNTSTLGDDAESGTLPSNFSIAGGDASMNVEAWTRQNTISPDVSTIPFGNDISAIVPNNDKSTMMEDPSKLTKESLKDLDGYNIGWNAVKLSQKKQKAFAEDSYYSEDSMVSEGSSDVISDLNNLSRMIRKQRTPSTGAPSNKKKYLYGPRDDE